MLRAPLARQLRFGASSTTLAIMTVAISTLVINWKIGPLLGSTEENHFALAMGIIAWSLRITLSAGCAALLGLTLAVLGLLRREKRVFVVTGLALNGAIIIAAIIIVVRNCEF